MQRIIRVRMERSLPGSPDGLNVVNYQAGEEYDLPEALAINFLMQGAAKVPTTAEAIETKVEEPEEVKEVRTKQGTHRVAMGKGKTKN